jgi:hypothetical protein
VNRALRQAEVAHPGRVFQVPYDWITAQPEAALAEICKFIGLPPTPELLQPKVADKVRVDQRLSLPIGAPLPDKSDTAESAEGVGGSPAASPVLESEREKNVRVELAQLTRLWRQHGPLAAAASVSAPLGPPEDPPAH